MYKNLNHKTHSGYQNHSLEHGRVFRNNAFFGTHTSKHQINNTNSSQLTEVTHSKSTQIDNVCAYKDEKLVQTFKALILPSTSSPMLSGASSTFWPSNSVSLAVQPPTLGQIQAPCKVSTTRQFITILYLLPCFRGVMEQQIYERSRIDQ